MVRLHLKKLVTWSNRDHGRTGNLPRGGEGVNHSPKKFLQIAQIFTKQSKRNEGHTMQQHRPYWHMKVPRYSLSIDYVAINKHLQKTATIVVLDKDENLS